MSSTNKTTALKLNQWVLDDPLLLEDFNADNLKIESAVKNLCFERIKEVTTASAAALVSVNVSDIDFTEYSFFDLCLEEGASSAYSLDYFLMGVNEAPKTYADDATWQAEKSDCKLTFLNEYGVWTTPTYFTNPHLHAVNIAERMLRFKVVGNYLYFENEHHSHAGSNSRAFGYRAWRYAFSTKITSLQFIVCGRETSSVSSPTVLSIPAATTISLYGVKK